VYGERFVLPALLDVSGRELQFGQGGITLGTGFDDFLEIRRGFIGLALESLLQRYLVLRSRLLGSRHVIRSPQLEAGDADQNSNHTRDNVDAVTLPDLLELLPFEFLLQF